MAKKKKNDSREIKKKNKIKEQLQKKVDKEALLSLFKEDTFNQIFISYFFDYPHDSLNKNEKVKDKNKRQEKNNKEYEKFINCLSTKDIYIDNGWEKFKKQIISLGLENDFLLKKNEKICCIRNPYERRIIALFRHIRNDFAHNKWVRKNKVYYFEDVDRSNNISATTARIILSE